jgi:hypothetical protein
METKYWVYGILAYHWVLIKIFSFNLPALPEPMCTYVMFGCVGWLIHEWFKADDLNLNLFAKGKSPRVLTNVGCFSWDGITKKIDINGFCYLVFYGNGANYMGIFYCGDVALVVPESHVVEVGKNRLVMTELSYGNVPDDVSLGSVRAILTGHMLMPQFRRVSDVSNSVDLQRQYQSVQKVAEARGQALDQIMRLFSDVSMLGKMLNPEDPLRQEILGSLHSTEVDKSG